METYRNWMMIERNITERILTIGTTTETADVQVEAAARREQCGCVQYEPPNERKSHHSSQPHHQKYTDEQTDNKITWFHFIQTWSIWIFWQHNLQMWLSIWAEKCRSGGNEHKVLVPWSFLAACVLKKRKPKRRCWRKSPWKHLLWHLTLTFVLRQSWGPPGGKNTQDQHAAGKLVFHVGKLLWRTTTPPLRPFLRSEADRTDPYSTLKIPLREQGSQFWKCQLTEVDATCGSTVTDTDLGPTAETHPALPGGRYWQACRFVRKHIESCICSSVSVTLLPPRQRWKYLFFIRGWWSLLDFGNKSSSL